MLHEACEACEACSKWYSHIVHVYYIVQKLYTTVDLIFPKHNAMWYLNLAVSFHKCKIRRAKRR